VTRESYALAPRIQNAESHMRQSVARLFSADEKIA
jgi:hypothetical protein